MFVEADSGTISVLTVIQAVVLGAGIWAIASMLRRFILRRRRNDAVAVGSPEPQDGIDEPNRRIEYLEALQARAMGAIAAVVLLGFVLAILSAPYRMFVAVAVLAGVIVAFFGVVEAIKTWVYIKSLRE